MATGGLTIENFRQIAVRGATDPRNSYAHSIAWFEGKLYIGTTRDSLCLMKRKNRAIPPPKVEFWPVNCPDPEIPELLRGQIICFDPATESWEVAYRSPMIEVDGMEVQRDIGYRAMTLHQGPSDAKPCLYAGSLSATGAHILRSEDGRQFETTAVMPGPSVRTLFSFRGGLYTSVVGQVGKPGGNESSHRELWEAKDAAKGEWQKVSAPGFGDDSNVSLFQIAGLNDYLYVSTMNPVGGYQIWKSDLQGDPPYAWERVLAAGAYRGFLNEFGLSLATFDGCLYVGSGIAGGGYDRIHKIGPAAAELVRIYPDDTWDLIVGASRVTPVGLKVPLSGMGPGFDNVLNGYLWNLCVHDGHLYVGTMNGAPFMKYRPHGLSEIDPEKWALFESLLPTGNLEQFTAQFGGCHLWRTEDGERFEPITRNGFGTHYNMGVRQMASSPVGLFVGTANPFGPQVGVKRDGKWGYEDNPRGGIEVWLGSSESQSAETSTHPPRSRVRQYRHALLRTTRQIESRLHWYLLRDAYEQSDFTQIGLWTDGASTPKEACEHLVDALASSFDDRGGTVLDVACGPGASTRRLTTHFPTERVMGIDESPWAIDRARHITPDVSFLVMDPARLEYPDASIEKLICVEGAVHIDTRLRFLKEAARVLTPGGRLVMADLIFSADAVASNRRRYRINYVRDLDAYRGLFLSAGFAPDVCITDATGDTVGPHVQYVADEMTRRFRERTITEGQYNAAMAIASRRSLFVRYYVLVTACKMT